MLSGTLILGKGLPPIYVNNCTHLILYLFLSTTSPRVLVSFILPLASSILQRAVFSEVCAYILLFILWISPIFSIPFTMKNTHFALFWILCLPLNLFGGSKFFLNLYRSSSYHRKCLIFLKEFVFSYSLSTHLCLFADRKKKLYFFLMLPFPTHNTIMSSTNLLYLHLSVSKRFRCLSLALFIQTQSTLYQAKYCRAS